MGVRDEGRRSFRAKVSAKLKQVCQHFTDVIYSAKTEIVIECLLGKQWWWS